MPDQSEKTRRKELLHAVKDEARRKVLDSLPVPAQVLKGLFDYVDRQLKSAECDNTLRHALVFIRDNGLPEEAVVDWLEENGGYCDCETLMNSEELVEEAVPGYRDLSPSTNRSE
jgi:hypothetical protein